VYLLETLFFIKTFLHTLALVSSSNKKGKSSEVGDEPSPNNNTSDRAFESTYNIDCKCDSAYLCFSLFLSDLLHQLLLNCSYSLGRRVKISSTTSEVAANLFVEYGLIMQAQKLRCQLASLLKAHRNEVAYVQMVVRNVTDNIHIPHFPTLKKPNCRTEAFPCESKIWKTLI
jgi:hypothetical protein